MASQIDTFDSLEVWRQKINAVMQEIGTGGSVTTVVNTTSIPLVAQSQVLV